MGVVKFQHFFRTAAGLHVHRNDLERYTEFIDDKIYNLFVVAKASAKANGRDVIEPWDLPITAGLQHSIHLFEKLDEKIELQPLLDQLTARPPLDLAIAQETEHRLPLIAGGLSVALAQTFAAIAPRAEHPGTAEWSKVFEIFHLIL
ncbi:MULTISPECIES: DUF1931 family protein [Nocardia]|uniref:DUF1931 family protein n=1 Tax=Nocardia TaxID=1817 RepID=UPI0018E5655D|nr:MULTISPECIES: DUF1931 family protein [Nocardia]